MSLGVRIIILFISAKIFSLSEFGIITLLLTISEVTRYIADFGLETYNMRVFSDKKVSKSTVQTIRTSFTLKLLIGSLSTLIAYFIMSLLCPSSSKVLLLSFSLMIFTSLIVTMPINFKLARLEANLILMPVLFSSALTLLVFLYLVNYHINLNLHFLSIPLMELILGLYLILKNKFILLSIRKVSLAHSKKILYGTLPLGASILLGLIYTKMDVFVIYRFLDEVQLGLYSFAIRCIEPLQFIAASIGLNAYSQLSTKLAANDVHVFKDIFFKYFKVTASFATLSSLGLFFFATIILPNFFAKFFIAKELIILGCALIIIRCFNYLITSSIQSTGNFKTITKLSLWNLLSLALFLWVLIYLLPNLNIYKILVSTLLMESISLAIAAVILNKIIIRKYYI
jgi:O-antigen/teichoic acid export membrane protein